ncbi:M50 family metallopeptidase [Streptococcus cuniculipharyngis]|uniref:M50 family metallopeptidase n=1 Tax=Streptococcus cuniculipharyngis TaxID=1562651 RepID=A0A5C5SCR6_9STRE|nr:M50 family metallopeptidase [Streptococcus cuniculipharyngis]TWS98082.1 M50 family metallopeptidase [Streptococcus cuniculipharyngis]
MKKHLSSILVMILSGLMGFYGTHFVSSIIYWSKLSFDWPVLTLIYLVLAFVLQIALHELGHLFFGWLTGYGFVSYRFFNLMWQQVDGKIKFFRYSIPGTAGQALMSPPDLVGGRLPYVLYNLGGGLANLVISFLSAAIFLAKPHEFLLFLAHFGLLFALINLIPLTGVIANDGANCWGLYRQPETQVYWWAILAVNAQLAQGKELAELPETYFPKPEPDHLQVSLGQGAAVNHVNWLMAKGELEEALAYLEELDWSAAAWSQIYAVALKVDQNYCELLLQKDVSPILTKKDWRLVHNLAKSQPSFAVFCYAYYSLAKRDQKKAQEALKTFEKIGKSYPYPAEYQAEESNLTRFQELALEKNSC